MTRSEEQAIRQYAKGIPVTDLPIWVVALEAAGGDPLRAAEIESQLSERWWARLLAYRRELARARSD